MSNRWFGGPTRPQGEVDWGRRVREDQQAATQLLWILMGINVAVFVAWTQSRGTLLEGLMELHFRASLESVAAGRIWTLITAAFSHQDVYHLLFNLIGLYVFGRAIAEARGARALLELYLVGGGLSFVGHVAYSATTGYLAPALGASGAVMALAAVFGAMFPNRTLMLNFIIPVPAVVLVVGFIVMDVVGMLNPGNGVANAAHLAGVAYGLLYFVTRVRRPSQG